MFSLNDDMSIYVTRGDIAFFTVTAADENGKNYVFKPGDVVRMKVTEKKACENVMFQKDFPVTVETETVEMLLTEADTKFGEVISKATDYWYEIELNPFSNPQTIIGFDEDGAKIFKLFPEGADLEPTPIEPEDIPVVDEELSLTSDRPVQNQAVSRALVGLDDRINATNVRFDLLCSLKEGSTTGDAELADIRIGADGTQFANAGEAVRSQVSDLKNLLLQHEADYYGPVLEAKESAAAAKAAEESVAENTLKVQEAAASILGVEENVQALEQNVENYASRAEDAAGVAQAVANLEIDTALDPNSYNPIANKAVAEALENVDAKTLDGHEAEYFFPKSGGTVNGNIDLHGRIDISTDTAEAVRNYLRNANRSMMFFLAEDGAFNVYDNTNSKFIMQALADGTNTFNGTASGNLPKANGTVNGVLNFKRSNEYTGYGRINQDHNETTNYGLYLRDYDADGNFVGIRISQSDDKVYYRDKATYQRELLHTGNSAKVHIGTTAPNDTTGNVLFINTSA